MRVLLWNVAWAGPRAATGRAAVDLIKKCSPEVLCLTEADLGFLVGESHVIHAESDYGYRTSPARRKVALWSREPWSEVSIGTDELPGGRFVSGVTMGVRFIGVCIPWKDAHVRTGRRDRQPWQDHRQYLLGLEPLVRAYCCQREPVCLLGDFNQRIPRVAQPPDVYAALQRVLALGFKVPTHGTSDPEGNALIDHVALSSGLACDRLRVLSRKTPEGLELSDHPPIECELRRVAREL